MKNSIEINVQFDFKGETYRPSVTLDLDLQMERYGMLPDLHQLLARENRIDPYSYQYEVLESSELAFANATGLAADYLDNGRFDIERFQEQWHAQKHLGLLQEIAREHMGIDDLSSQPALSAALLAAFAAGKKNRSE